jgi:hypothetical protein
MMHHLTHLTDEVPVPGNLLIPSSELPEQVIMMDFIQWYEQSNHPEATFPII